MSFWINDSFTENNLCEVIRGIAGDLVEEVCKLNSGQISFEDINIFIDIIMCLSCLTECSIEHILSIFKYYKLSK